MSEASGEVKVKLVVDSNSGKVADDMKKDFKGAEGSAQKTGSTIGSKVASGVKASAVAIGMIYAQLAHKAYEFGKDAISAPIEAFIEQEKQVKQLAATFSVLDQAGNSMENLHTLAKEVESGLGELALQSGQTGDDLVAAFNNVIERGGKSVDQAESLTKEMAYAARVVPGGLVGISEGFEQIQMGIVKAKNPLVGLISSTGLLKGSAKQVAKEMQGMSMDKQMALAEQAIKKMSEKAKQLPMSFQQAKVVLDEVRDNLLETAGAGLMKSFSKAVLHFKEMFIDAQGNATPFMDKLTSAAEWFGNTMGVVFDVGSSFVDGFVQGASIFSEDVMVIWKEIFGESDQMGENMKQAAHVIGAVIGGAAKFFVAGVGAMIVVVQKVVKYIIEAIGLAADLLGKTTGMKGLENFGHSAQQLAFSGEQSDRLAKMSKSGTGSYEANELRKEYITTAGMTGQGDYMAKIKEAEDAKKATENQIATAKVNANVEHAKAFYESFAYASKVHDEAAMKNIATFMGNNKQMAEAIAKLGPDVLGSAKDDFVNTLKDIGAADASDAFKKSSRTSLGPIGKTNITQNFSGPMTIKQDFKDSDPDRILVAFRKDLSKVGTNRLAARTSPAFGF